MTGKKVVYTIQDYLYQRWQDVRQFTDWSFAVAFACQYVRSRTCPHSDENWDRIRIVDDRGAIVWCRVRDCPFCDPESILFEGKNKLAVVIPDKYPVTEGHQLIVPTRHVTSFWNLYERERDEVMELAERVFDYSYDWEYPPDGFNVGWNDNTAAGQTVEHFHLHVIPRREGDVDDPTGGIRGVIPSRRVYRQ